MAAYKQFQPFILLPMTNIYPLSILIPYIFANTCIKDRFYLFFKINKPLFSK